MDVALTAEVVEAASVVAVAAGPAAVTVTVMADEVDAALFASPP